MHERMTRRTVTFRRPFCLSSFDAPQPAGTYRVDTYEELIEHLSFPVYLRIETLMHLRPVTGQPPQLVAIDPLELEGARREDAEDAPEG